MRNKKIWTFTKKPPSLSVIARTEQPTIPEPFVTNSATYTEKSAQLSHDSACKKALMDAAIHGSHEDLENLLASNIRINIRTIDGSTALMLAIHHRQYRCVDILLNAGADVHATSLMGQNALWLAVLDQDLEITQKLIDHGANANHQDHMGDTPLLWATRKKDNKLIDLLLPHSDLSICNKMQENLLMIACIYGHLDLAHYCLEETIEQQDSASMDDMLNSRNILGETALMLAIEHHHHRLVDLLLLYSVNIHIRDNDGYTPLMLACKHDCIQTVKILLDAQSDLHAVCDADENALMIAAQHGHDKVVSLLLQKGANPNQRNIFEQTAFDLAQRWGHQSTVQLLQSGDTQTGSRFTWYQHIKNLWPFNPQRIHPITTESTNHLSTERPKIGFRSTQFDSNYRPKMLWPRSTASLITEDHEPPLSDTRNSPPAKA